MFQLILEFNKNNYNCYCNHQNYESQRSQLLKRLQFRLNRAFEEQNQI
jgi:hypothetical protein